MRWYGFAEVRPRISNCAMPRGSAGAFVNIIAEAPDVDALRRLIAEELNEHDLDLLQIKDCEELQTRLQSVGVDDELLRRAEAIPARARVVFGTFFSYPPEANA